MSENYDVIIAGTGAGGLYSALNLPQHLKVLIITKRELILCPRMTAPVCILTILLLQEASKIIPTA